MEKDMKAQNDVYGNPLNVGDIVVKSANDTPRYAVILEFYTKTYPAGYSSDMVRIVNDVNNNQGLTYSDRLLHVTEDQVPLDVATKLFAKFKAFKETGHVRLQDKK